MTALNLTPFATGFFQKCAQDGLTRQQIKTAVERLATSFDAELVGELQDGWEKLGGLASELVEGGVKAAPRVAEALAPEAEVLGSKAPGLGRRLWSAISGGVEAAPKIAPGAKTIAETAANTARVGELGSQPAIHLGQQAAEGTGKVVGQGAFPAPSVSVGTPGAGTGANPVAAAAAQAAPGAGATGLAGAVPKPQSALIKYPWLGRGVGAGLGGMTGYDMSDPNASPWERGAFTAAGIAAGYGLGGPEARGAMTAPQGLRGEMLNVGGKLGRGAMFGSATGKALNESLDASGQREHPNYGMYMGLAGAAGGLDPGPVGRSVRNLSGPVGLTAGVAVPLALPQAAKAYNSYTLGKYEDAYSRQARGQNGMPGPQSEVLGSLQGIEESVANGTMTPEEAQKHVAAFGYKNVGIDPQSGQFKPELVMSQIAALRHQAWGPHAAAQRLAKAEGGGIPGQSPELTNTLRTMTPEDATNVDKMLRAGQLPPEQLAQLELQGLKVQRDAARNVNQPDAANQLAALWKQQQAGLTPLTPEQLNIAKVITPAQWQELDEGLRSEIPGAKLALPDATIIAKAKLFGVAPVMTADGTAVDRPATADKIQQLHAQAQQQLAGGGPAAAAGTHAKPVPGAATQPGAADPAAEHVDSPAEQLAKTNTEGAVAKLGFNPMDAKDPVKWAGFVKAHPNEASDFVVAHSREFNKAVVDLTAGKGGAGMMQQLTSWADPFFDMLGMKDMEPGMKIMFMVGALALLGGAVGGSGMMAGLGGGAMLLSILPQLIKMFSGAGGGGGQSNPQATASQYAMPALGTNDVDPSLAAPRGFLPGTQLGAFGGEPGGGGEFFDPQQQGGNPADLPGGGAGAGSAPRVGF